MRGGYSRRRSRPKPLSIAEGWVNGYRGYLVGLHRWPLRHRRGPQHRFAALVGYLALSAGWNGWRDRINRQGHPAQHCEPRLHLRNVFTNALTTQSFQFERHSAMAMPHGRARCPTGRLCLVQNGQRAEKIIDASVSGWRSFKLSACSIKRGKAAACSVA
jgi:hypothetical protein